MRCHDLYQMRHIYCWLAAVAAMEGKLAEAEQWLDRAQAIVERLASPEPLAFLRFFPSCGVKERDVP